MKERRAAYNERIAEHLAYLNALLQRAVVVEPVPDETTPPAEPVAA